LVHYRLNMSSDGGQTWKFTKSGQKPGGLVIDDGQSLQLGLPFGGVNNLRGNITALAADNAGQHIYAVYGKKDGSDVDRLWLAEFHPDGQGGLVERTNPVALSVPGERSALPSVAVTDNGTVFVMYDSFDGAQFHIHLAQSTDLGQTFTTQDLYDFTVTGIPAPNPNTDRLFGDYQFMTAVGNRVYGTFAARGNVVDHNNDIDTTDKIDPFFFTATAPEVTDTATVLTAAPSVSNGASASASLDAMLLGDLSFVWRGGGTAQPGDRGSPADPAGATPLELAPHQLDQLFAAIGQQDQGGINPASKPPAVGLDEN